MSSFSTTSSESSAPAESSSQDNLRSSEAPYISSLGSSSRDNLVCPGAPRLDYDEAYVSPNIPFASDPFHEYLVPTASQQLPSPSQSVFQQRRVVGLGIFPGPDAEQSSRLLLDDAHPSEEMETYRPNPSVLSDSPAQNQETGATSMEVKPGKDSCKKQEVVKSRKRVL